MENLPSTLPLDVICRAPPLNHRHETTWWGECFFLDDRLPWLDEMLDHGGLMAMLTSFGGGLGGGGGAL
jgi:hypothetical protein